MSAERPPEGARPLLEEGVRDAASAASLGELTLRVATNADRDDLRALCMKLDPADYVPDAWDEWRGHDSNWMLVAHSGGSLVGCIHASVVAPGQVFLQALRVDPDFRRHGVGRRLMDEQVAHLRARGVDAAYGITAFANDRARRFFETIGHVQVGVVRRRRLPGWAAGARSTSTQAGVPRALLASIAWRAHFRRAILRADHAWLAAAAREGRWHARDGAWALLDPPSREFGTWVVALGGPPDALAQLLRTLSPSWKVEGGMTVESPDDSAVDRALDALGFAPARLEDTYVILECAFDAR